MPLIVHGSTHRDTRISGNDALVYELGPEPDPDDIDGRSPAVMTWHDAAMHYLVASAEMSAEVLIRIAESLY